MLQSIRRNFKGTLAKVVVAIIIIPFALFGIETLLGGGAVQHVAQVNGVGISTLELQQEINRQKRLLLDYYGDNIDPARLEDQALSGPVLNFMIRRQLIIQAADDYGLAVSDQRLGESIADMAVFHVDGRFDAGRFRQVVSDQGDSPAGFQESTRENMLSEQLRAGLVSSEFATPVEVERVAALEDEQRDLRYLVMPLDDFRPGEEDLAADLEAWYEENQDRFTSEESADVEYIELKMEDFRKPVDEERLREVFEAERESYETSERRRVSHILFETREGESEEELQARVAAARARLDAGEDFADVAADASDDVGSATFGGDLGYTEGDTFEPAMEAAILALAPDEISPQPVETDAGLHILKLTELLEGESADFDAVRGEIETRIQDEEARLALIKTVEELRDIVFNADDLAGPAADLELTVQEQAGVRRGGGEGVLADSRLAAEVFSDEVLQERYNSEVVELAPDHFAVLRVVEHHLPETRPLEEVRDEAETAMADEIARERILEKAEELLARLSAGAGIKELAGEQEFEWKEELATRRDTSAVPSGLRDRLFELPAPPEGESTFEYLQNSAGDVELFELAQVIPGSGDSLEDAKRESLAEELRRERGQVSDDGYLGWLEEQADIVRGG